MGTKVTFTKPAATRIVRAVKQIEDTPPSRFAPGLINTRKREAVAIMNFSGYSIPRGGVVWLRERIEGVYTGHLVEYAGVTMVGIATDDMAVDGAGSVFVSGICPIMVDDETYDIYPLHFRLSVKAKSWTPKLTYDWGKFLVVGKETFPYLTVSIDGGYAHARRVG